MNNNDKTLIIGGAGFVGNSLAQYLADNGTSVVVADSQRRIDNYSNEIPNVEYVAIEWPLTSKLSLLSEVDNVVHLAWSSNPSSSMMDIPADATNNILGTLALLEQVCEFGVKRFIFMSSGGTVYGNLSAPSINESYPINPISAYGASKVACESYVSIYANKCAFNYLNIRLGNPYGEYQLRGTPTGAIANFINRASKNEVVTIYGDGNNIRDYIHIDDVSHTLMLLIRGNSMSGTYNLGSGLGYSINDILNKIQIHFTSEIKTEYLPARGSDVKSVILNSSKIQNELPYIPKISIDEGIASICQDSKILAKRGKQGIPTAT